MRLRTVGLGIALLLVAGTASAAGEKNDPNTGKGVSGPGSTGGAGPGGGASSGEVNGDTSFGTGAAAGPTPDTIANENNRYKRWEISGTFETHRLFVQEDLGEGAGQNKLLNYLQLGAHYDITRNDRIAVLGGMYQRFLADQGESGMRLDDISVSYTHYFNLPHSLQFRLQPLFTIPTSYDSQVQSSITEFRLTAGVSKIFGDLTLDGRIRGSYLWDQYTTPATGYGNGAVPNAKYSIGISASAEYRMPFHRPLSLGASIGTAYTWYYNVGQAPLDSSFSGAVSDATYPNSASQQTYRGELFVRYILPTFSGFKTDFTLAVANGDPTLGSAGVLHDGVVHDYLLYRQTGEVYGSLTVRY